MEFKFSLALGPVFSHHMVVPLEPDYLLMPTESLGQMYVWECFERLQNIISDVHKSI